MKFETCAHCEGYITLGDDLCVDCAVWEDAEAHSIDGFLDWEFISTVSEEKIEKLDVKIIWGDEY